MPFAKPVVNGVHLLQILLQIRKTIRHEKREKATMGLQGENPKTLVALSKSWFFREDRSNEKDTVRLPWQQSMDLKNPLEPQGLFDFASSILHHFYTTSLVTIC